MYAIRMIKFEHKPKRKADKLGWHRPLDFFFFFFFFGGGGRGDETETIG